MFDLNVPMLHIAFVSCGRGLGEVFEVYVTKCCNIQRLCEDWGWGGGWRYISPNIVTTRDSAGRERVNITSRHSMGVLGGEGVDVNVTKHYDFHRFCGR